MELFSKSSEDPLNASIEMQQAVTLYNQHRTGQKYEPITIGIGLHRGSLMLGTIGESERMEGTVISDNVNLASRIEGLTKYYGASILISGDTLEKISNKSLYHSEFSIEFG
jgi:class 3 adenylate cyclase